MGGNETKFKLYTLDIYLHRCNLVFAGPLNIRILAADRVIVYLWLDVFYKQNIFNWPHALYWVGTDTLSDFAFHPTWVVEHFYFVRFILNFWTIQFNFLHETNKEGKSLFSYSNLLAKISQTFYNGLIFLYSCITFSLCVHVTFTFDQQICLIAKSNRRNDKIAIRLT